MRLLCVQMLVLLSVGCTSSQKEEDFPDFTEEQIKQMVFQDPQQAAKWMEMESQMNSKKDSTIQSTKTSIEQMPDGDTLRYEWAKQQFMIYRDNQQIEKMNTISDIYSQLIDRQILFNGRIYYNRMLIYLEQDLYREALHDLSRFKSINKEHIVNDPSVAAFIYYKLNQIDSACMAYDMAKTYNNEHGVAYFGKYHQLDSICN